mmetsp:Transcript_66548/g.159062  ORF Transcript_66548/g.159062 Transcript_66548/m.159062 type:complete len:204 (+) Transcript_66548:757-1368(+)
MHPSILILQQLARVLNLGHLLTFAHKGTGQMMGTVCAAFASGLVGHPFVAMLMVRHEEDQPSALRWSGLTTATAAAVSFASVDLDALLSPQNLGIQQSVPIFRDKLILIRSCLALENAATCELVIVARRVANSIQLRNLICKALLQVIRNIEGGWSSRRFCGRDLTLAAWCVWQTKATGQAVPLPERTCLEDIATAFGLSFFV